ncbi:hypothetical protein RhiirC2_735619 [Rhizophagus irregularis]|uniref:Uncharacterized protein n=1 Tax=Rhizophagus irregularis TaxID=588596 RepID=A0A2N1NPP9_9GLOM|nr:hypothetical protein RhiirC2_735619 [Rhizophagus irregularis]
MSCNRHACVTHQKHLEKYNFVRKPQVDDNAPTSSKFSHATILYNSWHKKKEKHIFSQ